MISSDSPMETEPINSEEALIENKLVSDDIPIVAVNHLLKDVLPSTLKGKSDKERSFRIEGIRFPGSWMDDNVLSPILLKSESFDLKFNKNRGITTVRQGAIDVTFYNTSEAVNAYDILSKMRIDNLMLKIYPSDEFVRAMKEYNETLDTQKDSEETLALIRKPLFDIDLQNSPEVFAKRLYGVDISSNLCDMFISEIIGLNNIEEYSMVNDTVPGGLLQTEIIFKNQTLIREYLADFRNKLQDREDNLKKIKLFNSEEYLIYISQRTLNKMEDQIKEDVVFNDYTTEDIAEKIVLYMQKRPLTWEDIETVEMMYAVCDTVSKQCRGLPDSLLKEAMMQVLRNDRSNAKMTVTKNKVNDLYFKWLHEMKSEKTFDRKTMFKAAATNYDPLAENDNPRKRRNRKNAANLKNKMGMGNFLKKAKENDFLSKYKDQHEEEKESIEEEPNINEDGEPMSFDAWSKISENPSAAGVVTMDAEEMKKYVQPDKKAIITKNENLISELIDEDDLKNAEKISKDDKEEGEVSSDESTSDDEEDLNRAKKKRLSKTKDVKNVSAPAIAPSTAASKQNEIGLLLNKFYESRVYIIETLNENQKAGFLQYLKESKNSDGDAQLVNKIFEELFHKTR
uniref:RRM domain-containing protein n=1 Tax=Rhabditophanes sp. KR3021 TaxID=114890 RepID=A0AC35UGL0_9BILA